MCSRSNRRQNWRIDGTALIALANHVSILGIDRDRFAELAYKLAVDDVTGELTRITALQVCARMGERQILPVARALVLAGKTRSVPLRMSAIAAVGTLGGASDRAMLDEFGRNSDVRLRTAARSALKRLPVK